MKKAQGHFQTPHPRWERRLGRFGGERSGPALACEAFARGRLDLVRVAQVHDGAHTGVVSGPPPLDGDKTQISGSDEGPRAGGSLVAGREATEVTGVEEPFPSDLSAVAHKRQGYFPPRKKKSSLVPFQSIRRFADGRAAETASSNQSAVRRVMA